MNAYSFFENPCFSLRITMEIREKIQDLFLNTGINYFVYMRGEANGSLSILCSDPRFSLDWLDRGFTPGIGYSSEYKDRQTFYYFWEEKLPTALISLAQEKYRLLNGISIVKRYKNYFEMFGFADSNNHQMTSTYVSCLGDLDNFSNYFVKSSKHLIDEISQHPLVPPSPLRALTHKEICLAGNRSQFQVTGLGGEATLTSQDFFSLQLYVSGKSYKEIGKVLSISDKMVEKRLRGIKDKLGYHPRNIDFLQEEGGKLKLSLFKNKM